MCMRKLLSSSFRESTVLPSCKVVVKQNLAAINFWRWCGVLSLLNFEAPAFFLFRALSEDDWMRGWLFAVADIEALLEASKALG